MFKELKLTNFKAFASPQTAKIKPITLIYGPNSSGKSSLIQSMLLLKQTLDSAEDANTLLLPKGNLTDLGGYPEFINGHDVNKPFAVEVKTEIAADKRYLPSIVAKSLEDAGHRHSGSHRMIYDKDASSASLSLPSHSNDDPIELIPTNLTEQTSSLTRGALLLGGRHEQTLLPRFFG